MTNQFRTLHFRFVLGCLCSATCAEAEPGVLTCNAADNTCKPAIAKLEPTFRFTLQRCPGSPNELQLGYYADPNVNPSTDLVRCTGKESEGDTEYACSVPEGLKGRQSGSLRQSIKCTGKSVMVDIPLSGDGASGSGGVAGGGELGSTPTNQNTTALPFLPQASWQQALRELGLALDRHGPGNYYDRTDDVAVLFFDADGDSYYPIPDVIDEDDDVYVVVADRQSRMAGASIAVQGCNRPPSEPRIFDTRTAEGVGKRSVLEVPDPVRFVVRAIGKCAGSDEGGPQIIIARNGTRHTTTLPINPLYRLAVGVSAAFDGTRQREFSLRTLPGETVPRIAETRDPLGLSSLIYFSYYPIARDFRKSGALLLQRAQFFIGLDPRELDKHLVVGVGYELAMGLNLQLGWRVLSRQKVLAEGSGFANGMTFDGDARDLPTRERWEVGGIFIGAGVSNSLLSRLK